MHCNYWNLLYNNSKQYGPVPWSIDYSIFKTGLWVIIFFHGVSANTFYFYPCKASSLRSIIVICILVTICPLTTTTKNNKQNNYLTNLQPYTVGLRMNLQDYYHYHHLPHHPLCIWNIKQNTFYTSELSRLFKKLIQLNVILYVHKVINIKNATISVKTIVYYCEIKHIVLNQNKSRTWNILVLQCNEMVRFLCDDADCCFGELVL